MGMMQGGGAKGTDCGCFSNKVRETEGRRQCNGRRVENKVFFQKTRFTHYLNIAAYVIFYVCAIFLPSSHPFRVFSLSLTPTCSCLNFFFTPRHKAGRILAPGRLKPMTPAVEAWSLDQDCQGRSAVTWPYVLSSFCSCSDMTPTNP